MKTILVIDGQGGKMGATLVTQLKTRLDSDKLAYEIIAVGSNYAATSAMLKAGADAAATGENPVVVNSQTADIITGPIGIINSNSLYGEITPSMAIAVSGSKAKKVLIPVSKCNITVAGTADLPLAEYVKLAVKQIAEYL